MTRLERVAAASMTAQELGEALMWGLVWFSAASILVLTGIGLQRALVMCPHPGRDNVPGWQPRWTCPDCGDEFHRDVRGEWRPLGGV